MIAFNDFYSSRMEREPYSGWKDHIQDYMSLIEMLYVIVYEKRKSKAREQETVNGIPDSRASARVVYKDLEIPAKDEIDIAEQRVLYRALKHIISREKSSKEAGVLLPLCHVGDAFALSAFERFCIAMSLAVEVNRKYEKIFGCLQDNFNEKYPSVGTAISLYRLIGTVDEEEQAFLPSGVLFKYILDCKQDNGIQSRLSRLMRLDESIYEFLIGKGFNQWSTENYVKVELPDELPELYVDQEKQTYIKDIIKSYIENPDRKKSVIYLEGPYGAGKKLQVRHLVKYIDMPLVLVDANEIKKKIAKPDEIARKIVQYTVLYQGVLCIHGFEVLLSEDEGIDTYDVADILNRLSQNIDLLFILSEKEWKLRSRDIEYSFIKVMFEIPDDSHRLEIWKRCAGKIRMDENIDLAELSNKLHFTPGMIEAAVDQAAFEANISSHGIIGKDTIYNAGIRQSNHNLGKKATKVKAAFNWEDLKIPDEQKHLLFDACNQMKYRHIVLNKWGFDKKLPYGRGLGILFYGPPGTGKTMGAQVLANELKLEMYKIDLSQLVSKYIGETEKNLKEVFDEANQTSAILFFDEADALFGKRTEAKDSNDRYANMETSYLLQKMEEYDGITILATNLINNFDEAYRRRFKFMINFPMPDAATRRKIWDGVFPKRLPMDNTVDLDFMAEQFEISGSNIKNIAVASSFLAAGEGQELGMRHILRALKNELSKAGKVVIKQDLGGYAELLQ